MDNTWIPFPFPFSMRALENGNGTANRGALRKLRNIGSAKSEKGHVQLANLRKFVYEVLNWYKLLYRELKMPCSTQEWSRILPYEAGKPNP